MGRNNRDEGILETQIIELIADPQYQGHPLQEALVSLFGLYSENINQIERLTSISDGYQTVLQERNRSISERYRKQMRQLQKIVRISDHYQGMLRDLNAALKIASTQDPLTSLANRRLMLERLDAEAALAERRKLPFSLITIDVDHFKTINDEYGHDAGDIALVCIARAIVSGLRGYDVCARWGGEEFLVLLPETGGKSARETAERLRVIIESIRLNELPDTVRFTVSIGVAEHAVDSKVSETIKRSDVAMYEAKKLGRNRVVWAE